MHTFPETVRRAMAAAGTAVTCVPVQLGRPPWEVAIFFRLQGDESARDRAVLSDGDRPLSLGFDADLIANEQAAVVMLRAEVETVPDDPLAGEILLTPGDSPVHFQILRYLSTQPRLTWFFGQEDCRILRVKQHPLGREQRAVFDELSREAVRHDSLIRCTGRYDAAGALAQITSHYAPRSPDRPSRTLQ